MASSSGSLPRRTRRFWICCSSRNEVLHPAGQVLIDHRHIFVSLAARESYGRYARSQIHDAQKQVASGSEDHRRIARRVRHAFRLLQHGRELLATGRVTVRVANREELFAIGAAPIDEVVKRFDAAYEDFLSVESHLPEQPDLQEIDEVLIGIRERFGSVQPGIDQGPLVP